MLECAQYKTTDFPLQSVFTVFVSIFFQDALIRDAIQFYRGVKNSLNELLLFGNWILPVHITDKVLYQSQFGSRAERGLSQDKIESSTQKKFYLFSQNTKSYSLSNILKRKTLVAYLNLEFMFNYKNKLLLTSNNFFLHLLTELKSL